MKALRTLLLALPLVLLLLFLLLALSPATTLAANSDFTVSVDTLPHGVGPKGGTVSLNVTVHNEGATDITWLDVVVNTQAGFSERITHTITPGHSYGIGMSLPLAPADLGKQLIVQVAMNNNASSNPDGVKMVHVQVARIDHSCQ